jgi:hypothetical protein
MTRNPIAYHNHTGDAIWYNRMMDTSTYLNKYEIFHSDEIPAIEDASVFRLEVVWRLWRYSEVSGHEDGFTLGYLTSIASTGTTNPNFRIAPLISGLPYTTNLKAINDELPANGANGGGYTIDNPNTWRYSVADVSAIDNPLWNWVGVAHCSDDQAIDFRYTELDDMAVVIY